MINFQKLSQKEIEFIQVFLTHEKCTQENFKKGDALATIHDTLESLKNKEIIVEIENIPKTYLLNDDCRSTLENYTFDMKNELKIAPPSKINKNCNRVEIHKQGRGEAKLNILDKDGTLIGTSDLKNNKSVFYNKFFGRQSLVVEPVSGHPAVSVNYGLESSGTLCALTAKIRQS